MRPAVETTNASALWIDQTALEQSFPFFLAVDAMGRVQQAGPLVLRAMPDLLGSSWSQWFEVVAPSRAANLHPLDLAPDELVIVRARPPLSLALRGHVIPDGTGTLGLFLGGPAVRRASDLERLGIRLSDIPLHDATGDLIMTLQQRERSMVAMSALTMRLAKQQAALQRQIGAAERAEALVSAVVETSPDAVVTVDDGGRVTRSNEAAHRMFQRSSYELLDLHIGDILRSTPGRYWELVRRDGVVASVDVSIGRVDDHGAVLSTYFIRDRTKQVVLERRMREAKEAAEAAARVKSSFLANMSHELRTPLNAVIGMASLLEDGEVCAAAQQQVRLIRQSADTLLSLINHVLDYSRVESGTVVPKPTSVDLQALLDRVVEVAGVAAAEAHVHVLSEIEPEVPPRVLVDGELLRDVLLNLVSNAVKFTHEGEIVVRASVSAEGSEGRLFLDVIDTGVGIPEDLLPRLFEPFVQSDDSRTRRHGGTGLGLAIAAGLVRSMGGEITVESRLGEGSCFRVQLPARSDLDASVRRVLEGRRVWLVDAHAATRRAAAGWLRRAGARVETFERLPAQVPPQVALIASLCDVGVHQVRALHQRRVPTLAVVWPDRTVEVQALVESWGPGNTRLLARPLTCGPLQDEVVRLCGDGVPRAVAPPLKAPASGAKLRVLVAEDNAVNQRVVLAMLRRLGVECDVVDNGADALDAMGRGAFDLVLMDVHMPVMDGLEATRRSAPLRRDGWPKIHALTASVMPEDQQLCREAGMDGFLAKPLTLRALDELLSGVRSAIQDRADSSA